MQISKFFNRKLLYGIGWPLVIIATAIPAVGWMAATHPVWSLTHWNITFASIGKLTGIIGFMLFAIDMVLAVRKNWLEDLFGGLNRVYIAHHIIGGLSLIFICFHPLFLALMFVNFKLRTGFDTAARFLLPREIPTDASVAGAQQALAMNSGIIALLLMVVLLLLTFYVKLAYNSWLFSHKFLGVAFILAALHVLFYNSMFRSVGWLYAYTWLWTILGVAAFVLRTVLGEQWTKRYPYQVTAVANEGGDVAHLTLAPIRQRITFEAGQFVFIRFILYDRNGKITREAHPFSISSGPQSPQLELRVKALGDFTHVLQRLAPGTIAEIEGPFGRFIPSDYSDRPQVWIAGGIGIVPFLAAAHNFKPTDPPVLLLYTVSNREELLETQFLGVQMPGAFPQFCFVPFVSSEQGHLSAQTIAQFTRDGLRNKEFFLCGPPSMMKSVRAGLERAHVSKKYIHDEAFGMTQ